MSVYLVVDALDVWPKSHFLCLFLVVVGVTGLVLIDGLLEQHLPLKRILLTAAISAVACAAVYAATFLVLEPPTVVPPAAPKPVVITVPIPSPPAQEGEVTGLLQPGNSPTPPNGCDHAQPSTIQPNALKILIGTNGYVSTPGINKITAIEIGKAPRTCDVLTMERTVDGIQIGAELYGAGGNLIARINKNGFHAISGPQTYVERQNDLSTLIIKDKLGNELLYVRYLHPTTIQARGVFGCPGYPLAVFTDTGFPNVFMTNSCLVAGNVAVHIE